MQTPSLRLARGGILSLVLIAACYPAACNNDNFSNRGVITAGARFQLVIEPKEIPTRLLLDSATGDLWQLQTDPAGGAQWLRVASGPADARVLTPQEALVGHTLPSPTQ